jgi:hypothetical protein
MRRAWCLLLLLCLQATAHAKWDLVPLETLVQDSDLIVVGTLQDVSEHTSGGTDYGQGHILVREVIWGQVRPGDALLLKWSNLSGIACPRIEHRRRAGEEGIWLLTAEGGYVEADYPGRFVEPGRRQQVERTLARFPVSLRGSKYFVGPGEPLLFAVVYRNFSRAPRFFPGVSVADGHLRLGAGSRLAVKADLGGEERRLRLSRVMTKAHAPAAPVMVAPGGEHRVEINLRDLLDTEPVNGESYDLRLFLPSLRPTNEIGFYLGRSLFTATAAAAEATPARPVAVKLVSAPRRARGLAPHRRAMLTFVAAFSLYLWLRKRRAR